MVQRLSAMDSKFKTMHAEKAKQAKKEQLEIIDENENVIGLAPRKEFHDPERKQKLLHRVAHVVAIDLSTGKIWAQKRTENVDLYPGTWEGGVGGHFDPGEKPENAALRECKEEFGFTPKQIFFLGKYIFEDHWQRQMNYLYWFKTSDRPLSSSETQKWKLMAFAEFKKLFKEGKVPFQYKYDIELLEKSGLFM